jgi:hypothetical protein
MIGYNLQYYIWVWMCVKTGVHYSPNCYFNGETDDKALEIIEGQFLSQVLGRKDVGLRINHPMLGLECPIWADLMGIQLGDTRCIIHEASMCRSV